VATSPDLALRTRTGEILMSAPCQRIDFHWAHYHIDGSGFSFVALATLSRGSKGVHFKIEHQPTGVGARYFPSTNMFSVPTANFGVSDAWQKMALVHECTHALIDATHAKQHTRSIHDELAAYVASALFNIYSAPSQSGPFPYTPVGIFAAAHQVALNIANATGYAISPTIAAPLRQAILQKNVLYPHPNSSYDNNGIRL